MNKNRLFNMFVTAALALMVALTFRGAIETAGIAMAASAPDQAAPAPLCDRPVVETSSIRRVYVEQMDSWLTYTDGAPTGVDGGLIHLLLNARVCSN